MGSGPRVFRDEGVSCRISALVRLGTQNLQKVLGFVNAAMSVATVLAQIRSMRLRLSSNLVAGLEIQITQSAPGCKVP